MRGMDKRTTSAMTGITYTLTLIAVLGTALAAGAFFAFSSFIMDGLGDCRAVGAEAMQGINRKAVTPVFMTLLFGTALVCVWAIVHAATHWGDRRATLMLAGAVVYLVGAIVLTIANNVPLNDALMADAGTWSSYLTEWTAWNHVRTVASLAACGLFAAPWRADPSADERPLEGAPQPVPSSARLRRAGPGARAGTCERRRRGERGDAVA